MKIVAMAIVVFSTRIAMLALGYKALIDGHPWYSAACVVCLLVATNWTEKGK